MTGFFQSLIANPTIRAYVIASIRHLATAAGAALVARGLGDASTSTALVGLAMAVVSWGFSQLDVKKVDAKINRAIALAPDSPAGTIAALKNGKF